MLFIRTNQGSAPEPTLGLTMPVLLRMQRTLGPVLVRGLAMALAFGLQIMLARALGPVGFGIYSLSFSVLLMIIIVALQGHDVGAIRIAAPLIASRAFAEFEQYRTAVNKRIWLLGSMIPLGILLFSVLSGRLSSGFWQVMILMAFAVPFIARSRFSQGILRAGGRPTQAYLPEGIVPPLLMIPLVSLLAYLMELQVLAVGAIFLLAAVANWSSAIAFEKRVVPASANFKRKQPTYALQNWRKVTAPIYLSSMLAVANDQVVFLMLGAMQGEYAAGLFSSAGRFMVIAGMVGTTLYFSHASTMSVLYGKGDMAGLAGEVGRITRLATALTLAICLPLMIWPEFFLGLFGSQFTEAVTPFRILVLASFINVAMGPVGLLLNMCEYERTHTRILAVTLVFSALLGVVLVPLWNITGAAVAMLLSTLFWNGFMLYVVRSRIGFIPTLARAPVLSIDLAQAP